MNRASASRWVISAVFAVGLIGCGPMAPPLSSSQGKTVATLEGDSQGKPVEDKPTQGASGELAVIDSPHPQSLAENATNPQPTLPVSPPVIGFRPDDDRPKHDDAALEEVGLHCVVSKHLRLYSDVPVEEIQRLPELVDQLFSALGEYFGPVPPNRENSPFQVTGYLIKNRAVFRETGLLPEDLPTFEHGRHRGARFWMFDPPDAYYRRHLLIHEATHCFMTIHPRITLPAWYLEGTAELFGTHRLESNGRATFRVFPDREAGFEGWGRVKMIQRELSEGNFHSIAEMDRIKPDEFLKTETYAWAWAVCWFLDHHPTYRQQFQNSARELWTGNLSREFRNLMAGDSSRLAADWTLFVANLQLGYDLERAATVWLAEPRAPAEFVTAPVRATVRSNRGWHETSIQLEKGTRYRIQATGEVTLARTTQPWVSEANGITLRYISGEPLGRLMGCIDAGSSETRSLLKPFSLGNSVEFVAENSGRLLMRVNDAWGELRDNTGEFQVLIEKSTPR